MAVELKYGYMVCIQYRKKDDLYQIIPIMIIRLSTKIIIQDACLKVLTADSGQVRLNGLASL